MLLTYVISNSDPWRATVIAPQIEHNAESVFTVSRTDSGSSMYLESHCCGQTDRQTDRAAMKM